MGSAYHLGRKVQKQIMYDMYQNKLPQVPYVGPNNVWHVNSAISDGDGKSWNSAFDTMTEAIDACSDGDTVLLAGELTEHIDYSSYAAGPDRISILGVGIGLLDPTWLQVLLGTSTSDMIDLQCHGWTFDNIRFRGPKGYDIFKLDMPTSAGGAMGTTIKNCWFRRPNVDSGASYGINVLGPYDCRIINNNFMIAGTGAAIGVDGQGFSFPNGTTVAYNRFYECGNQIDVPYINSFILYNTFQGTGHENTTTKHLDLSGGHDNTVFGNSFGGDYSTASGSYVAGSGDNWIGNWAEDVAETTEVDASTGMTKAIPAS